MKRIEKENAIVAYKGFDKNLCCRGYQYEIGKEYHAEGDIKACNNGFHACPNPNDLFVYYAPNEGNRYCKQHGLLLISKQHGQLLISRGKR